LLEKIVKKKKLTPLIFVIAPGGVWLDFPQKFVVNYLSLFYHGWGKFRNPAPFGPFLGGKGGWKKTTKPPKPFFPLKKKTIAGFPGSPPKKNIWVGGQLFKHPGKKS